MSSLYREFLDNLVDEIRDCEVQIDSIRIGETTEIKAGEFRKVAIRVVPSSPTPEEALIGSKVRKYFAADILVAVKGARDEDRIMRFETGLEDLIDTLVKKLRFSRLSDFLDVSPSSQIKEVRYLPLAGDRVARAILRFEGRKITKIN